MDVFLSTKRAHLEAGLETALFKVLRARAEGVHEVPTDCWVALALAHEHRAHVGENAVEHGHVLREKRPDESAMGSKSYKYSDLSQSPLQDLEVSEGLW